MNSSISSFEWRRFFLLSLGTALLSLCVVACFTLICDPFGVFYPMRDTHRAGIWWNPRFSLPLIAEVRKPEIVVLGSSRIRDGFDPSLFQNPDRVLIFGVSGLLIDEQRAYAEQVARLSPKKIYIGFDFFSFNPRKAHQEGFIDTSKDRPSLLRSFQRLALSTDAMLRSWQSITGKEMVFASGFQKRLPVQDIEASILANARAFHSARTLYGEIEGYSAVMESARKIFLALNLKETRVYAFINPEPEAMLSIFADRGLRSQRKAWVSELASLAAEQHIPFFDFSARPDLTNPDRDELPTIYFDGSHYTPKMARYMMRTMEQD